MRKFVVPTQVLATLAALVLAGCGGGGSTGSGTGTSASGGSSFVSRADFVCRTRNDAQVAANQNLNGSASGAVRFTTALGTAYQKEIVGLKALSAPASAHSPFEAFIADQESILNNVHAATQDAQKGDVNGYKTEQGRAFATEIASLPKASAAGLTVCAEKLPASDQAAIRKLAIDGSVNPTADLCVHSVTHHFLVTNFQGSVTKCEAQITKNHATSATITQLYGILPSATAFETQQGANPPKLLLGFMKEKGTWRVDSVAPAP
ncbi:MAG: hypothetical protein ACJ764_08655 [Solirubrobacteraceae bacterium]